MLAASTKLDIIDVGFKRQLKSTHEKPTVRAAEFGELDVLAVISDVCVRWTRGCYHHR